MAYTRRPASSEHNQEYTVRTVGNGVSTTHEIHRGFAGNNHTMRIIPGYETLDAAKAVMMVLNQFRDAEIVE